MKYSKVRGAAIVGLICISASAHAFFNLPLLVGAKDPYWGNVVLLTHMDGVNGSSVFIDQKGLTLTADSANGYATSTTQVKFGPTSGAFPATGGTSAIGLPTNANLTLTADFTIETWIYATNIGTVGRVVLGSNYVPNGVNNQLQINEANTGKLGIYNGTWSASSVVTITLNTWHHIALSRVGSTVYFYLDGTQVGTAASTGTYNFSAGAIGALYGYTAGSLNARGLFTGYMDDFRITNGVGRYTGATIQLPAAPYPNR